MLNNNKDKGEEFVEKNYEQSVKELTWHLIKEQLVDITKQQVITKDNVNISVDGIVFLKVFDAKMAVYNVDNYKRAIANLAMTTLRGEIGAMNLDDTLSSRDRLNAALQVALGDAAGNWGVKIMRVEISEISVPCSIQEGIKERKSRKDAQDVQKVGKR